MRALEAEVKELKDLLDEKDETIDVLSKLQSHDTLRGRSKSPEESHTIRKEKTRAALATMQK